MKENKDFQIKFRLTASQKKEIEEYCEAYGLNASEFLRLAVNEFFNRKNEVKYPKEN